MQQAKNLGAALDLMQDCGFPFYIHEERDRILLGTLRWIGIELDTAVVLINDKPVIVYDKNDDAWAVGSWDEPDPVTAFIHTDADAVLRNHKPNTKIITVGSMSDILWFVRGGVKALGAAKLGVKQ